MLIIMEVTLVVVERASLEPTVKKVHSFLHIIENVFLGSFHYILVAILSDIDVPHHRCKRVLR